VNSGDVAREHLAADLAAAIDTVADVTIERDAYRLLAQQAI
jgi:hypothetical protein